MIFRDRSEAGRRLAERLLAYRDRRPVVLGLPRGGIPVAYEIAVALDAPLEALHARKIGVPGRRELALGALLGGDDPIVVLDEPLQRALGVPESYVGEEVRRLNEEIAARRRLYEAGRQPVPIGGRTAVVVDDGIATGQTMRAALRGLRRRQPAAIVLAVPVAPADVLAGLRGEVEDLVCLAAPDDFAAISPFYADFSQVDDATVAALLRRRSAEGGTDAGPG